MYRKKIKEMKYYKKFIIIIFTINFKYIQKINIKLDSTDQYNFKKINNKKMLSRHPILLKALHKIFFVKYKKMKGVSNN